MVKIIDSDAFSEFYQDAILSFLFSMRVPSETLQIRRALPPGALDTFPPQPEKALIGFRLVVGIPFLTSKFHRRKNLTGGCSLRRPCSCSLAAARAASLCPVHALWSLIRRRVASGQPLSHLANRRNFNRKLNAIMANLHIPDSHRFSSHAFRRGATQELEESGSPWSAIAYFGILAIPCFRFLCGHVARC